MGIAKHLNRDNFQAYKSAHEKAVASGKHSFVFKGYTVLTAFYKFAEKHAQDMGWEGK